MYCIRQCDYSRETVGRRALKRGWLQKRLGDAVSVQSTVSIPYGTLGELLSHHHENNYVSTVVRIRYKAAASMDADVERLEWASELKKCRSAH